MKALADSSIPVKSITDMTGFPEILDGRVKTLHPAIHGGILARLDNKKHIEQMKEHNLESIDLLVVNLYPFEQTLENNSSHEELIENIDIGGPGMLRAAAKNYLWTAPVTNPGKYSEIIEILKNNGCTIDEQYRLILCSEVFSHTSYYDSLIAGYLNKIVENSLPVIYGVPMSKAQELRYGENPHQHASLYGNFNKIFKQIHGKELSYNNILDIDGATKLILEFEEPSLAIIKHTNPCGVASGASLKEAWEKAYTTDTISAYGGIIAVNRQIDKLTAETIHSLFTELIIAPEFTGEALEILTKKRDRRLIVADYDMLSKSFTNDVRAVAGGFLVQKTDTILFDKKNLKVATNRAPSQEEFQALMFAWKVCKHVKSNAIVYTSADRTLGIGAGQMSRVDSARIAVEKAKMMGLDLKGSVLASDAYFPFADGIIQAVEAGATAIIQPGGSVRDEEVIREANENNIAMLFTGMRHFRH